jgi:hypothetical protein
MLCVYGRFPGTFDEKVIKGFPYTPSGANGVRMQEKIAAHPEK